MAAGGDWYWLAAAPGFLATAWLLVRRHRLALPIYALAALVALAWALAEVGLDWPRLAPRGAAMALPGAWLLLPWTTRGMAPRGSAPDKPVPPVWRGAGLPLTVALGLWGGAGLAALLVR